MRSTRTVHPWINRLYELIRFSPDPLPEAKELLRAIPILSEIRRKEEADFSTRFPLIQLPTSDQSLSLDISFKENSGEKTFLMIAADEANDLLVSSILEAKANPNCFNSKKETALHIVATYDTHHRKKKNKENNKSYARVIQQLIDSKADMEAKDNDDRTALFYAATNPNPEVIRTLLQNNAIANHRDKEGHTPLSYLATYSYSDMREHSRETAKLLLDAKVDINLPGACPIRRGSKDLVSPLMSAVDWLARDSYPLVSFLASHRDSHYDATLLYHALKKKYQHDINDLYEDTSRITAFLTNSAPYFFSTLNEIADRVTNLPTPSPILPEIIGLLSILDMTEMKKEVLRILTETLDNILPIVLLPIIQSYDAPFHDTRVGLFKQVIGEHLKTVDDRRITTPNMRSSLRANRR